MRMSQELFEKKSGRFKPNIQNNSSNFHMPLTTGLKLVIKFGNKVGEIPTCYWHHQLSIHEPFMINFSRRSWLGVPFVNAGFNWKTALETDDIPHVVDSSGGNHI